MVTLIFSPGSRYNSIAASDLKYINLKFCVELNYTHYAT